MDGAGPDVADTRPEIRQVVRTAFDALDASPRVPPLAERRAWLMALRAATRRAAEDLARAVDADFGGRPRAETLVAEVGLVLSSIDWTARRLGRWMRPRRPRLPPEFLSARARVERVPLGRVGILAPWNYPVQLALLPLATALAGGNRALVKPSEFTPRTAEALARLIEGALPGDVVRVVTGGPEVAAAVSSLPLDGLFFTGSTATGRKVARAAAENLVPLVLELGGKSPAIILPDADMDAAALSIMAGKLFSAGQTCVAPDYALVPRRRVGEMVEALRRAAARLHPDPARPDYAALARAGDRDRLLGLLEGYQTVPLMDPMPEAPRLGPFAVLDPDPDSRLMREEIFGPILPLVPYDDPAEAEAFANARPCPLALYVFGRDTAAAEGVVARVRSGGAMVNDTLLHVAAHSLPFGGAGESGMGAYHGEEGFLALTRPRSVMVAGRWMPAAMARPPYGRAMDRLLRWLIR
ncbi:aldehyde dehydrogenase family protein [Rubellimicrobium sp. CFH 75288]|uniref:aldehyde dehydrogenase family protein n=1 Tax=Rubellimicrobium sp. CFH 75288 TaxID=2697034 RepID=UPI0014126897|nr:aldehyde dehydrogenase family protein [Rubellimicrobium sp. CFH 75288]NAZ37639.1 aldehyde dehydrogenase family protein [Rubellimicrobium sp. CFH 75288]